MYIESKFFSRTTREPGGAAHRQPFDGVYSKVGWSLETLDKSEYANNEGILRGL